MACIDVAHAIPVPGLLGQWPRRSTLRIPGDGDQRSEVMSITLPK